MARIEDLPPVLGEHILKMNCPTFEGQPWVEGPPLNRRRIALVSTAGLQLKSAPAFALDSDEYRVIPEESATADILMSHTSSNFDRTGFQQDVNVVFPLARLKEIAREGRIGSVARFHYSFVGSTPPWKLEAKARQLSGVLKEDAVDSVVLVPV